MWQQRAINTASRSDVVSGLQRCVRPITAISWQTASWEDKEKRQQQIGFPCTTSHPQITALSGKLHFMFKAFKSKAFCGLNSFWRHCSLCVGLHCDLSCTQHQKFVSIIFFLSGMFMQSGSVSRTESRLLQNAARCTHVTLLKHRWTNVPSNSWVNAATDQRKGAVGDDPEWAAHCKTTPPF